MASPLPCCTRGSFPDGTSPPSPPSLHSLHYSMYFPMRIFSSSQSQEPKNLTGFPHSLVCGICTTWQFAQFLPKPHMLRFYNIPQIYLTQTKGCWGELQLFLKTSCVNKTTLKRKHTRSAEIPLSGGPRAGLYSRSCSGVPPPHPLVSLG